jgi:hypothetical protein
MTSKPTILSDAGLSIAPVKPDTGMLPCMRVGMDHPTLQALLMQHLSIKASNLSRTYRSEAVATPLTWKLPCIIHMDAPRTVRHNRERRYRHCNAA